MTSHHSASASGRLQAWTTRRTARFRLHGKSPRRRR